MGELITIKSFLTSFEAHLMKGQLQSAGIHCFLKNESIVNTHAIFSDNTGQIELQVNEEQAKRALEIIDKD